MTTIEMSEEKSRIALMLVVNARSVFRGTLHGFSLRSSDLSITQMGDFLEANAACKSYA